MRCYARLNQTSPATLRGAGERLATRRPRGQENGWEVDSGVVYLVAADNCDRSIYHTL